MENRAAGNSALIAALGKSFSAAVMQRKPPMRLPSPIHKSLNSLGHRSQNDKRTCQLGSFRQITPPDASRRSPVPSPRRRERQPQMHLSSPNPKPLNCPGSRSHNHKRACQLGSFRQTASPGVPRRSPAPSPSRPERQPQAHLSSPTPKSLNSVTSRSPNDKRTCQLGSFRQIKPPRPDASRRSSTPASPRLGNGKSTRQLGSFCQNGDASEPRA